LKNKFLNVISIIIILLLSLVILASMWIMDTFESVNFEQLIFNLRTPVNNVDRGILSKFLLQCILPSMIIVVLYVLMKKTVHLEMKILIHRKYLFKVENMGTAILTIALVLAVGISSNEVLSYLGFSKYIDGIKTPSTIFEDYYVDPRSVQLSFPEEKQNLVYIFVESMETTYMSQILGGAFSVNIIPELTDIATNNTSFSTENGMQGAYEVANTGWTVAAMVAQTSGVPLKIPIEGNSYSEYSEFLPGVFSLGDILKKNGYNQTIMLGSDAEFGGRKNYFEQHGNYKILDYNAAIRDGKIPSGYKVWWGFEDGKLFEFAKQELLNLARKDEPFNFTMLTADTHFVDGYFCEKCGIKYDKQYSNVIACTDAQVGGFVRWIQQQDFYNNTTIVIAGDHRSMDPEYFKDIPDGYSRNIYNAIINPCVNPVQKSSRYFSTLDFFPTTLAAIGVHIENERLGLGVNLFSASPSLCELLGPEELSNELLKHSKFYDSYLLYC